MTVRIGHASIDEHGKVSGGAAGDQTGKEVCIRTYYNKPWKYVIRANDTKVAELIARACIAGCNNNNIGYDQSNRNSIFMAAKAADWDLSKIAVKVECDCSSFVTCCVMAAGVDLEFTNAPTTSTLLSVLVGTGNFIALNAGTALRRGDILLAPGSHTAIVLDDSGVETGGICTITLPIIKLGSKGTTVKMVQTMLAAHGYPCANGGADGSFGTGTQAAVKKFQSAKKLTVDGVVGTNTYTALLGG